MNKNIIITITAMLICIGLATAFSGLGTGSMLLPASNYCLNMTGQDISPIMILTAKVNFTLYIPWAITPYPEQMLKKLQEEKDNGTAK